MKTNEMTMTATNKGNTEENTKLYDIRMKHERAGRLDVDSLRKDTDAFLAEKPKPSAHELNILAGSWAFVAENMEREAWKYYTREDWEELERYHVEKASYTEPDLFDDITTAYEQERITADEARAKAKEYRKCSYIFCENVYRPKRKAQRFCTGSCRNAEVKANQRFENTGTYLPASAYKELRDDSKDDKYYEHERSFTNETIADVLYPASVMRDEYGGKRDRVRENILDRMKDMDEGLEMEEVCEELLEYDENSQ